MRHLTLSLTLLLLTSCSSTPPTPEPTPKEGAKAPDATAELDRTLQDVWDANMKMYPGWATYEGIRTYDADVEDLSQEAQEAHLQKLEAFAKAIEAIDPAALSPTKQDTRRMFLLDVKQKRAKQACKMDQWSINGLGGPQVSYPMKPVFHSIRDQKDVDTLEARYRKLGVQTDQRIANLRLGLRQGLVASKINVNRAITQLESLLKKDVNDAHPMLKIKPVDKTKTYDTTKLQAAVIEVVNPALARYLNLLKQDVLPKARTEVGLGALPLGKACYATSMQGYIGPGYTAKELHERGLKELDVIEAGMIDVGKELGLKNPTATQVIQKITKDKALYATSEAQLVKLNNEALERARATMPKFFGILPTANVEVRPMEAHRAPDAPAAYYNSPPKDGSRPGIYYVNTHAPSTRPLFNLQALAFHEAIPGHHLQIAIAKERPGLHVWRKNAGQTAFVEGWALYAELLAQEMGLYTGPLDRFGMHNYQAWRAARLVVDTGIHAMGWSRERAIEFMTKHTALPANEIANEVDRYIAWPGQALSYMVGRMKIQELRVWATQKLGPKFNLSEFHDQVLGYGAIPLTILDAHIKQWVQDKLQSEESGPKP